MIPRDIFAETILDFFAPVRPLFEDASVSEVMINGPYEIYIERRGLVERTGARFSGTDALLRALRNVAQFVGKHLDEGQPILEARLPDGSRVQAVIAPVAPDGPYVSIRRFMKESFSRERLVELGTLSQDAADTLRTLLKAKLNVLIAGGTGSGKTSLLNMLTHAFPESDRVIVIEDCREVQVQRPHVVYMEARPPDPDGRGAVSIRELFRASLRMRPDRIVIGELRGGEALDIIQAMVSGHGGCLGTLHATYPRDTLTRLETMALMSDIEMPLAALRLQIASGLNFIVQLARLADGSRKVTHITEVVGFELASGKYELADIFVREYHGSGDPSRVLSELVPTGVLPRVTGIVKQLGADFPPALYAAARAANRGLS